MKLIPSLVLIAGLIASPVAKADIADDPNAIVQTSTCQALAVVQAQTAVATAITLHALLDVVDPEGRKVVASVADGLAERALVYSRAAIALDKIGKKLVGPQGEATYTAAVSAGIRQRLEARAPTLLGLDNDPSAAMTLTNEEQSCSEWMKQAFAAPAAPGSSQK